jgi:hypothetical protein
MVIISSFPKITFAILLVALSTAGVESSATLGEICSGELRASRVPREYWRQRLKMVKALGLDTVRTYLFWNLHICPRLPNGQFASGWFNADGVCSRNRGFVIIEFNASSSAPLTIRQTQAFPPLGQYGGSVRGLKGGDNIPQVRLLPPLRVQIIRQNQFQPSELIFPTLGGGDGSTSP